MIVHRPTLLPLTESAVVEFTSQAQENSMFQLTNSAPSKWSDKDSKWANSNDMT